MFVKILGFLSLLFLMHCNQGKVDLEECGCEDSNRIQYLVTANVGEDQIGEFIVRIVDLQSGVGGASFERVRIDGLCAEMETRRVVFCVEDRDYQIVREQFQDFQGVNLTARRVD